MLAWFRFATPFTSEFEPPVPLSIGVAVRGQRLLGGTRCGSLPKDRIESEDRIASVLGHECAGDRRAKFAEQVARANGYSCHASC